MAKKTKKIATGRSVSTWYGGGVMTKMADLSYYPPRWFSPLLSFVHFYVPWDRATLYQWIRYFDTWHPVVGAAIDIHVQMPLSRFSLRGISDPYIMRVYEQQLEELRAFLLMYDQLSEWWTIGEVFTLPYWDDEVGLFTNAEILMPEYVEIKSLPFIGSVSGDNNLYYLTLDSFTLEALKSEDPDIQKILDNVDADIRDALASRGKLKIDPNLLMIMMKRRHAYQNRAQPIILRVMKELIYESKLVEAMYTIAERHVNPKEIWKIGNDNFPADDSVLSSYESLIRTAENQPLFTLVVPHVVSLDIVGATGKFPNLSNELDWVEKRILTALLLNKAVVHGEGPNYATASVATRTLLMRYMEIRAMLEDEWINKIFLPVALKHNFLEVTQAELDHGVRRPFTDRKPILPYFDWSYKMRLLDDTSFRDRIIELYKSGKIPAKIVTDVLGIDYQYWKDWKEKEEGSILDPLYEEWRKEMLKKDIDMSVAPKGIKKSSLEPDSKPFNQVLEEADRKNQIFSKYIAFREQKEGRKFTTDEKESMVKNIKEHFENKEFSFPTRGVLRKMKIAEEILKKGNLDLAVMLAKEVKQNED